MFTERDLKFMTWRGGNPRTPDWRYSDGEPKGFMVKVQSDNSKAFYLRYQFAGERFTKKLGDYGPLSLAMARQTAQQKLYLLQVLGQDPYPREAEKPQDVTVSEFAEIYFKVTKHLKSFEHNKKRILRTLVKFWGDRPLKSLTREEVRDKYGEILATGKKTEANHFLKATSAFWNTAIDEKALPEGSPNPVERIKGRHREQPRKRFVQDYEMPYLLRAIEAETDHAVRTIFWLSLLLGLRPTNARAIKWDYINFRTATVHYPADVMKNGLDFDTALPQSLIEAITRTPKTLHNPYVFVGKKPGSFLAKVDKPWERILTRAEKLFAADEAKKPATERYPIHMQDIQIRDLRRTFGTWARKLGIPAEHISDAMAHKAKSITQHVYSRGDIEEKRAAIAKLEAYLRSLLPKAKPGRAQSKAPSLT